MNPRHRRLLIPGLLIALLVVVLVSSLARKADGAEADPDVVSRISDARIIESSGLVISRTDDDLAYTINDSGSQSLVFAVDVPTGATVGTLTVGADLLDTEALSIDGDGTLWIADTGDNRGARTDVALYSVAEPGRADVTADDVRRFPLTYPDGPRDVEALAVNPRNGEKFLLTKGLMGGEVYAVPEDLVADRDNRVKALDVSVPAVITDAAFTPDGAYVIARNYFEAYVLDARTWEQVETITLPPVQQGETLAVEPDGTSFLIGSEGAGSPLIRVRFDEPSPPTPEPTATSPTTPAGADGQEPPEGGSGFAGETWIWAAGVMALLVAIAVAATRRT